MADGNADGLPKIVATFAVSALGWPLLAAEAAIAAVVTVAAIAVAAEHV